MPDAYQPGALAYMPLRFGKTPTCRFCKKEFPTKSGNAKACPACRLTSAYKQWRQRQRSRWDSKYRSAHK